MLDHLCVHVPYIVSHLLIDTGNSSPACSLLPSQDSTSTKRKSQEVDAGNAGERSQVLAPSSLCLGVKQGCPLI